MTKAEFLEQFNAFNEHIESALAAQNFDRVVTLDIVRREMLHDFTASTTPDGDQHFFEALERCAEDNARAITQMTVEMNQLQQSTGAKLRGLSGYRT
ncbi:hypothetical protein N9W44_00185 [Alphaproteobacteria bacterium]|jgi:hypothetical protein|nr:hypothetical protein [Alphaproteobacteria bacterium]